MYKEETEESFRKCLQLCDSHMQSETWIQDFGTGMPAPALFYMECLEIHPYLGAQRESEPQWAIKHL